MSELTQLQKNQLIQKETGITAEQICAYIQKFSNLSLDDFPKMAPEKRKWIQDAINSQPNESERSEWFAIEPELNQLNDQNISIITLQTILEKLTVYINRWRASLPKDNNVSDAENLMPVVKEKITQKKIEIEERDWVKVNPMSKQDLIGHLYRHPDSAHKDEIDDSIWGLVNNETVSDINEYLTLFPAGRHVTEANGLLTAITLWNDVKIANDIFETHQYIHNYPESPFKNKANLLLLQQKQAEVSEMRNFPDSFSPERLLNLLDKQIFHDYELYNAEVLTPNILTALKTTSSVKLPEMQSVIDKCVPSSSPGGTDVFFWGIPSTGKTCVLMGLSCAARLDINLASGGGTYAEALMQYTENGKTVPQTPGGFVTAMDATIYDRDGINHSINLIEMSGEEFAFEIAKNQNAEVSFEKMGTGTTKLLESSNRKVFFIIIDPTASVVPVSHRYQKGFDEETGRPIYDYEYATVNQRTTLKKLIDLFNRPENRNIMKKVDAIHFIITKSDTLDRLGNRDDEANKLFKLNYEDLVMDKIVKLSEECEINAATNHRPKLYTFSLGRFYIGGLYEYNNTDSDKLVKAIKNSTHGIRKETFWQKIQKVFN